MLASDTHHWSCLSADAGENAPLGIKSPQSPHCLPPRASQARPCTRGFLGVSHCREHAHLHLEPLKAPQSPLCVSARTPTPGQVPTPQTWPTVTPRVAGQAGLPRCRAPRPPTSVPGPPSLGYRVGTAEWPRMWLCSWAGGQATFLGHLPVKQASQLSMRSITFLPPAGK